MASTAQTGAGQKKRKADKIKLSSGRFLISLVTDVSKDDESVGGKIPVSEEL